MPQHSRWLSTFCAWGMYSMRLRFHVELHTAVPPCFFKKRLQFMFAAVWEDTHPTLSNSSLFNISIHSGSSHCPPPSPLFPFNGPGGGIICQTRNIVFVTHVFFFSFTSSHYQLLGAWHNYKWDARGKCAIIIVVLHAALILCTESELNSISCGNSEAADNLTRQRTHFPNLLVLRHIPV